MKKLLLICSIFLLGNSLVNAQLITFDDQGHTDLEFLPNPYTIVNGTESFRFTFSNGGAALPGSHRYRTTDTDGCGIPGPLSYLRVDPSATTWTMETVSGNEINLGNVRFLNMFQCFNYAYAITITGYKNGSSTGSQALSVTNENTVFTPNANFDDVDKVVITSIDIALLGIDNINWGSPIVACTEPTIPTITATQPICSGSSTTLNISGTLNDATEWHIYTGFCGVTEIGSTTGSTFVVSPTSTTSYFIRGEGGCATPGTCGAITVNVNSLDDASFSYSASSYCANDSDPTPTITGLGGGTFSAGAGLSISASIGAIDVSTSTPGTYTVTYTTTGSCPNSSSVSVTINALDDASFSYSSSSYCADDSDPSPTITGLAGGTFSSTAGLAINASTGTMDVSASTPGTYSVTYTTSGSCANSSSVTVTINALDDASFSYSSSSYCANDSDPTPTITGLGGGTFSAGAGLSISASTGAIDVSTSTPGTYTVTYTTSGSCPNSSSVSVTINALPSVIFTALADLCLNSGVQAGLGGGSPLGGVYSGAGVTDDGNGQTYSFDPAAAGVGTHTISYNFTDGSGCSGSANDDVEVFACAGAECNNAIAVTLDPCGEDTLTESGTTVGGTPSTEAFCGTSLGSGGANWYTFTGDGRIWTISTVSGATNYDTKLWVYDGSCGALVCVAGNDDFTGVQSQVTFPTTLGTNYYVVIGGFSANEGNYELTFSNSGLAGVHNETVCDGESIVVNGTTYDVNNPIGTEVFTNVGSNMCDSTVTVTLTILPALTGTDNTTICATGSVVINGTTYDAATPTGTEVFTNVGPNMCDSTVTVALNVLPALTGTDNTTICATGSVVINGTTYDAATPNGTEVFTNVGPNGCDSTVTVALNVLPALTGTDNTTICATGSVVINGTTYDAATPTGTEVFTNVGSNMCDSIVTVALNVLPALTGTQDETVCDGGSIVVNGTTYDASNLTGTEVFTNVGPSMCDSTVTVTLTIETAVDVTIDNTLMPTLTANQTGATYQWVDCDNGNAPIATETGQSFTATVNGNYAVEVTVGSCTELSACEAITGVGIKEVTSNVVSIYPNPTSGLFTISLTNTNEAVNYTITTLEGRIVEQANNVTQRNIQVDLTNESKGVYLLRISENDSNKVYKIVKQ